MSAEEEVAKGKADETQAIAAEAQRDLDEALPALDAAQKVCQSNTINIIMQLLVLRSRLVPLSSSFPCFGHIDYFQSTFLYS